jgi:hypothetical protein
MAATKNEYDHLLVEAAQSVLLELARLLHEYEDGMVVVGGSVPGLIMDQTRQAHIGTIDVDIALNHTTIQDVAYRSMMQLLIKRGYQPGDQPFIFYRSILVGGQEIKVEVDFLAAEYGGTGKKHRTQVVQDLRPRKARACDLAFQNPIQVTIEGVLPGGGKDRATIRVASIVPFLMMKAQALAGRLKEKDAYDIYYCLVNYPGGSDVLAESFRQFPNHPLIKEGLNILADKFQSPEHIGPVFVTNFLGETHPDTRSKIQRDVFERVNDLLRKIGILK